MTTPATTPDSFTTPDDRRPTGWANYSGNVVPFVAARHLEPMGPNYMGELMWPVEAVFDRGSGRTRVGFSLQAPELHEENAK